MNRPLPIATFKDAQIVPLQRMPAKHAYLMVIEGDRCIASNHYGDCGLTVWNVFTWAARHLSAEFECDVDDVCCIETDDGDRFTVNGMIVAYLAD